MHSIEATDEPSAAIRVGLRVENALELLAWMLAIRNPSMPADTYNKELKV